MVTSRYMVQDCPGSLGLQGSMEAAVLLSQVSLGSEEGIFARSGPAETPGVSL